MPPDLYLKRSGAMLWKELLVLLPLASGLAVESEKRRGCLLGARFLLVRPVTKVLSLLKARLWLCGHFHRKVMAGASIFGFRAWRRAWKRRRRRTRSLQRPRFTALEETHEKMQCWCKSNGDEKSKSISEGESRVKVGLELLEHERRS